MTVTAGVDIGSTASKAVVLRDDRPAAEVVGQSTTNPARTAEQIYDEALERDGLSRRDVDVVIGTGYGRTLVPFADKNVSEITCHGRGAHFLCPAARTIVDIGGQDTKVVHVDERGNLLDFAMNDKCAAGTGRFLEAMARSMDVTFEQMQEAYFAGTEARVISNMCSVFAESEVINLINDGVPIAPIVRGLLQSLAGRVSSLSRRLGLLPEVVMTGGVAKNPAVRDALERKLRVSLAALGDADPQTVGALGAALVGADLARAGKGG